MCVFDDDDDGVCGPAGVQQQHLHPECLSAAAAHPAVFTHPESEQSAQHRTSHTRASLTHVHAHPLTTCLNLCMYCCTVKIMANLDYLLTIYLKKKNNLFV